MQALLILALIAQVLAAALPALAAENPPGLTCMTGSVKKTFGGTEWTVGSCNDDLTIVVVSAPGNPAMPYVFVLSPKENGYDLRGEGAGIPSAIEAAAADLRKLTPPEIAAIIVETKTQTATGKAN